METMKKTLLIPFFVVLTFLLVGLVAAAPIASVEQTKLNGVTLSTSNLDSVVYADDTVPIRVTFTANADTQADITVRINGLNDDVEVSRKNFNILDGKTYTELFSLKLPSRIDERVEEITLYVEIDSSDRSLDRVIEMYNITIQRNDDELSILSIDYNTKVTAGEVFPISIVVKNTGYNREDDNYVVASIPSLSISSRNYAGDLIPVEDYKVYDDEEDSVNKIVYLRVPEDAPAGVYELTVTAYNDDAKTEVTKLISIEESQTTTVLAATKSQDVSAGETAEFELIILNTANTAKVFSIDAISSKDLLISAPSVVVVGAGASETVTITVKVPQGTEKGIYTFSTNVEGKQVVFAANVISDTSTVSSSIVGLTVVLVIVFVVLLAILIILISRKDNTVEEVETSYY